MAATVPLGANRVFDGLSFWRLCNKPRLTDAEIEAFLDGVPVDQIRLLYP